MRNQDTKGSYWYYIKIKGVPDQEPKQNTRLSKSKKKKMYLMFL